MKWTENFEVLLHMLYFALIGFALGLGFSLGRELVVWMIK